MGRGSPGSGGERPTAVGPLYRGELVAVLVVGAYLAFLVATAATSPPVDVGESGNQTETLVGIQGPFSRAGGYAVVLGPDGTTRWQSPEAWAHFDVDRLDDGRILAAFMVRDRDDCGPYESPCARTGFRIYDPDRRDPIVREWTFPVRTHVNSEVHDATMLPSGNVAVADMEHERIVIVDSTGSVVWQWNASAQYEPPPDPTRTDWLHINDLDYLGDGRFLVSVRNANQLLVINRQKEVLEVVNKDGNPDIISEQHNPQYLSAERILVADSGNDRVVGLRRDPDTGRWNVEWHRDRAGGVAFNWPRDVDLLPSGHLLITDTFNHRIVELDANGSVVWSTSTRPIPYEADRNGTEYPTGLPLAAGEGGGGLSGPGSPPASADKSLLSTAYVSFVGTVSAPFWFELEHFVGLVVTVLIALTGIGSGLAIRLR